MNIVQYAFRPSPSEFVKRSLYAADCQLKFAYDETRLEPQHAVAEARERLIPTLVRAAALCVVAAIDFDDEAHLWRNEVDDEPADDALPPKRDTEGRPRSADQSSTSEAVGCWRRP